jgi:hypothetical protein
MPVQKVHFDNRIQIPADDFSMEVKNFRSELPVLLQHFQDNNLRKNASGLFV